MKRDDSPAIVWRDEGYDDSEVSVLTLKELREKVMYVMYALKSDSFKFLCKLVLMFL